MSATGSFAGALWSSRIEAGVRLPLAARFSVIPLASLTWNRLNVDSYAETGGGGASLAYAAFTTTSLKSGIGARFTTVDAINHWRPELHVLWNHEFRDRRVDTSASYAGGTPFVTPGMTIRADAVNLGGGLTYAYSASKSVNLAYDYEARPGYASNAVKLTGRWEF
jgi:outer membrane autotransporter protein